MKLVDRLKQQIVSLETELDALDIEWERLDSQGLRDKQHEVEKKMLAVNSDIISAKDLLKECISENLAKNLDPENAFNAAKEGLQLMLERQPTEQEILDYALCLQKRALIETAKKHGIRL